jgi:inorganic pyrophosphatase
VAFHPWHDVELPRFVEDPVPAIIEIPTGSKVKYELDKKTGLLLVDRVLFSAVHYPANYGFIPRTYCDDGDPLDVLVLCEEEILPLAIMRAKVIGVMNMRDDKGQDDKIIAVHLDDPSYADYSDVSEIPGHKLRELQRFFQDYKALENKKGARLGAEGPFGGAPGAARCHRPVRPGARAADGRAGSRAASLARAAARPARGRRKRPPVTSWRTGGANARVGA